MKVFITYLRTLPYLSNKNSLETLKIFSAIFSVTISLHFMHIFIFDFSSDISPSYFLYETLSHYFENLERLVNKITPETFQIVSIIFSTMISLHFVNIFIFDFSRRRLSLISTMKDAVQYFENLTSLMKKSSPHAFQKYCIIISTMIHIYFVRNILSGVFLFSCTILSFYGVLY